MNNTTSFVPDAWNSHVRDVIKSTWAEQAFHRPSDREEGIERLVRKRSDFNDRSYAVAGLVAKVMPFLDAPGQLTDHEYHSRLGRAFINRYHSSKARSARVWYAN
jgi:hypothetical protein